MAGICYLVGAGPGDLGLVTLRAKECIEMADVIAGGVIAMLDELNGLAKERALVHAADEPLNHMPGAQIKPGDARHRLRAQETAGVIGHAGRVPGTSCSKEG